MNHTSIEKGIFGTGCLIIIANIVILGLIVCGVVYGCNKIREKGLKGVVETVWEGTNQPPSVTSTNQ